MNVPPGAGNLVFTDPRGGNMPPFEREHRIQPAEGELIMFPPWLKHEVTPNCGAKEGYRISISFNYHGDEEVEGDIWGDATVGFDVITYDANATAATEGGKGKGKEAEMLAAVRKAISGAQNAQNAPNKRERELQKNAQGVARPPNNAGDDNNAKDNALHEINLLRAELARYKLSQRLFGWVLAGGLAAQLAWSLAGFVFDGQDDGHGGQGGGGGDGGGAEASHAKAD